MKIAIDTGYRHFDCAMFYGNEKEIGNAINQKINESVVTREDLYITSKVNITLTVGNRQIYNFNFSSSYGISSIDTTLSKLC